MRCHRKLKPALASLLAGLAIAAPRAHSELRGMVNVLLNPEAPHLTLPRSTLAPIERLSRLASGAEPHCSDVKQKIRAC